METRKILRAEDKIIFGGNKFLGQLGNGLKFDGVNDYAQIPTTLNYSTSNNYTYTYAFIVTGYPPTNGATNFDIGTELLHSQQGIAGFYFDLNRIYLTVKKNFKSYMFVLSPLITVNIGDVFVVTHRKTGGTYEVAGLHEMFINGIKQTPLGFQYFQYSSSTEVLSQTNTIFRPGKRPGYQPTNILMLHFSRYSTLLSDAEIQALHSDITIKYANPDIIIDFNQNRGTQIVDSSGNGFHGTFYGNTGSQMEYGGGDASTGWKDAYTNQNAR